MQSAGWDLNGHEMDEVDYILNAQPTCRWCGYTALWWNTSPCPGGAQDAYDRWLKYSETYVQGEAIYTRAAKGRIREVLGGVESYLKRREEEKELWQNPGV
jgi:hypothetical protein